MGGTTRDLAANYKGASVCESYGLHAALQEMKIAKRGNRKLLFIHANVVRLSIFVNRWLV